MTFERRLWASSCLLVSLCLTEMAQVSPAVEEDRDRVALRVRFYADGRVDHAIPGRALETAKNMLDAAGLVTAWRLCTTADACQLEESSVPEVVVILSSRSRPAGREDCGVATRGAHAASGTVLVFVPCVAEVAHRIARRLTGRSHPLLAEGRHDDLAGAVVAHEIGHLLGMRHAPTGLMRARFEADDIVTLRLGRFGFSQEEVAVMRARGFAASRRRSDGKGHHGPANPSLSRP